MNQIMKTRVAARLHVLLARDAPVGLVIRRGPAKSVCTILWDRRRDLFEVGQWLKGRIYERRSDLSPNGKHFIYFALNGRMQDASLGSWTAVSRVPYLKAVCFVPTGHTRGGGGVFLQNSHYWIHDRQGLESAHDSGEVRRAQELPGEIRDVYSYRLVRDGWSIVEVEEQQIGKRECLRTTVYEKKFGDGWLLRKLDRDGVKQPGVGRLQWEEHELIHRGKKTQFTMPFEKWEWADVDGSRLVWAEGGALYSGKVDESGLCDVKQLADFNGMKFEAIAAPY